MARRKHRKVKGVPPGWKGCKCPKGARKVSTCSTKKGVKVCKGRGWGCLGTGVSQRGKSSPRFVRAICPDPQPKLLNRGVVPQLPAGASAGSSRQRLDVTGTKLAKAIQRVLSK